MSEKKQQGGSPVAFLAFLPGLVQIARDKGYTLAVHGSFVRDYDMIAVAWTHGAKPPEELIAAFVEHTGGLVLNDPTAGPYDFTRRSPEPKPHGRLAWRIDFENSPSIDISVIPPEPDSVVRYMERLELLADQNRQQLEKTS